MTDPGAIDDTRPVRYALDGGIATITLDSPGNRNALSRVVVAGIHAALDRVVADGAGVRAVVVTHTPPVFCAGLDLKERRLGVIDSTPFTDAMQRLRDLPQPTIAAVKGPVRAGGIGLMAVCDLPVVHSSVDFAFTEVRIGVAPAMIAAPIMTRVSWSALAAPFLTGAPFDADAALAMGLVTHVADDVDAMVAQLTSAILLGAPAAMAETKRLLRTVPSMPFAEGLVAMRELSDRVFGGAEAAEGMAAFRDKRPPSWQVAVAGDT